MSAGGGSSSAASATSCEVCRPRHAGINFRRHFPVPAHAVPGLRRGTVHRKRYKVLNRGIFVVARRGRGADCVQEVEALTRCPECKGEHLVRDYERAEIVCNDCGLVLDESLIDEGPEWRAFDSEQRESRERAGPPSTIMSHDKGLSTSIGWRNKDAYGRQIPHKSRAQIYRLRKWQHRIRTSKSGERSLAQGLTEINTMASKMGLPRHVRESPPVLYPKASTKNLVRGRSIDEVVAATLYAACRQCNVPRTLDEIAGKTPVDRKSIGRTYRTLVREL